MSDPARLFKGVGALTFDCYGTLIDWETGLRRALRTSLGANAAHVPDEALLNQFAAHESRLEGEARGEGFVAYREVLWAVLAAMAGTFNARVRDPDALGASIRDWPAFPDTSAALRRLKSRFRLCVVSNIDDDLFEMSRAKLGVELDEIVTAEQVRSYKPRKRHFKEALARLGLPASKVVHVAQSLYHDIAPASELGLKTVWVNRQAGRPGATPASRAKPDLEVPDMATLAEFAAPEAGETPAADRPQAGGSATGEVQSKPVIEAAPVIR
ncbi:MAG: haloacid dehalogenase type II [Phycisphaerales bacterium]|nr:haloacid dehalogenase type II [Phycisphaerales bacterium]